MPEYLAPGVYVEEIDTGNKPIEGVSTSTAGILGVTERGPVNVPILVTSYGEYTRWFGGRLNKDEFSFNGEPHCYLPHAVEGFFTNGGQRAYITRVLDTDGALKATTFLFDRGAIGSLDTVLLRPAGELTGTAANPPLLYVLDVTGLAANNWIRIGDGSPAEYRQVVVVDTSANNTHVALNFPLNFSHDKGVPVDEIARTVIGGAFTLVNSAPQGETAILIQGAAADISALAAHQLLEIGGAAGGEFRFITSVTPTSTTQALVHLAGGLVMPYSSNATVTRLDPTVAAIQSAHLDFPANAGDRLIFVDNRGGNFTNTAHLVTIALAGTQPEIRRIGELDLLTLTTSTTDLYPAGSVVEEITLADDFRSLTAASAINDTKVTVDDVTSLVIGQKVLVGPSPNPEAMVILLLDAGTKTITFTAPLANAHAINDPVALAPKALTAQGSAGMNLIALDDRLGLQVGDVLRIGAAPNEEYASIKLLPNRSPGGAAPDAGNVILAHALSITHPTGTQVWRQKIMAPPATQPTVTALDVPANSSALLVTDGHGFTAGNLIQITTPTNDVFYESLAAVATTAPAQVTLSTTLERAHAAGSPFVVRSPLIEVDALDAGAWGNRLRLSIQDEPAGLVTRTTLATIVNPTHIRLASAAGVEAGTILELLDPLNNNAVVDQPLKVVAVDRTANYTIILQGTGLSAAQQAAQVAANAAGKSLGVRSREYHLTVQWLRQPDPALPSRDDIVLAQEDFRYLSMDSRHSRYVQTIIGDIQGPLRLDDRRPEGESWYIRVHDLAQDLLEPNRTNTLESIRLGPEALIDTLPSGRVRPALHALEGGDDSIATLTDDTYIGVDDPEPIKRTGLYSLTSIDDISLIACPGRTSPQMQEALITQCELLRYRFAVLDGPRPPDDTLSNVQTQRQQFDTKYAALYHPWLLIPDPYPTNLSNIANYPIPPSGHVLGVYARTDIDRGVHKAPANELVQGIIGLQRSLNKGEQDILNPYPVNINVIRDFRNNDRGIRVYGGRVITSDPDWKYVNVRRLLIYIEQSLDQGLQWVVFEPNAEPLWARVRRTISNFLTVVWRNGALEGTKPEEAYFVKCDRTTMTQTDIDNGRLICVIGVAPVKPAEFVIIRIGLWTAQADN